MPGWREALQQVRNPALRQAFRRQLAQVTFRRGEQAEAEAFRTDRAHRTPIEIEPPAEPLPTNPLPSNPPPARGPGNNVTQQTRFFRQPIRRTHTHHGPPRQPVNIGEIIHFIIQHAKSISAFASASAIVMFYALYGQALVDSNTIEHQEGPKLPESDAIRNLKDFHLGSYERAGGRSGGRKYAYDGPDGIEYFYVKEAFDRERFLRELLIGTIARELIGPSAPEMILIQEDLEGGQTRYHIGSKSMSGSIGGNRRAYTQDLEDWTRALYVDDETGVLPPNGLGVVVALDVLLGNRDVKLANIVTCDDPTRIAYPIDHEGTNAKGGRLLLTPDSLFASIKEFAPTTLSQIASSVDGESVQDDPNMPLRAEPAYLDKATPYLMAMIKDDVETGQVNALFHRAATLSDEAIEKTIARFPGLMSDAEKEMFREEFRTIRNTAQKGLAEADAYQAEVYQRVRGKPGPTGPGQTST